MLYEVITISALISAIGVSFFLQNVTIVFFQAIPRAVYRPEWMESPIIVGNVRVLPITLFVPVLSRITSYNVCYTKLLRDMRALAKTEAGPGLKLVRAAKPEVGHNDVLT